MPNRRIVPLVIGRTAATEARAEPGPSALRTGPAPNGVVAVPMPAAAPAPMPAVARAPPKRALVAAAPKPALAATSTEPTASPFAWVRPVDGPASAGSWCPIEARPAGRTDSRRPDCPLRSGGSLARVSGLRVVRDVRLARGSAGPVADGWPAGDRRMFRGSAGVRWSVRPGWPADPGSAPHVVRAPRNIIEPGAVRRIEAAGRIVAKPQRLPPIAGRVAESAAGPAATAIGPPTKARGSAVNRPGPSVLPRSGAPPTAPITRRIRLPGLDPTSCRSPAERMAASPRVVRPVPVPVPAAASRPAEPWAGLGSRLRPAESAPSGTSRAAAGPADLQMPKDASALGIPEPPTARAPVADPGAG